MIAVSESEHPERDMHIRPTIQSNGPIDSDHRQTPRLAKLPTAPNMDRHASASFTLGDDISLTGFAAEVSASSPSLALSSRMDTSKLQEDPETELQVDPHGHISETPEPRKSDGFLMIERQTLSQPVSGPTGAGSMPDEGTKSDPPETSKLVEGETLKTSATFQQLPETPHSSEGLSGWKAIQSNTPAQVPVSDPLQATIQPVDTRQSSDTASVTHLASAPLDASPLTAVHPPLPTATSATSLNSVVQTALTPLAAELGSSDPAPPPAMVQSATRMPETTPVAVTPGTTSHDTMKAAGHASASDDPVQMAQVERFSHDGWSRSEARTTPPQSSPSLSFTASPALAGSPFQIAPAIRLMDDPITTSETFIASDEPLPDMTAPQLRDLGLTAMPARSSPELPRLIAAQLADVARSNPDKPVELTLNPEELGRVRMTFQTEASSMNVILQVERPETLDMMRRHIEQLAQDMHELGYEEVSFSFQQQQQDTASNGQSLHSDQQQSVTRADASDALLPQDVVQIHVGETTGIDIRI